MIKRYYGSRRGFVRYWWHWFRSNVLRHYKEYLQLPSRVDRVVFVCKGNICRSPFAEAILKNLSDLETASFGLDTTSGCMAHEPIIRIAESFGVDLSSHRTVAWNDFVPKEYDLFVCVEPEHANHLKFLLQDASIVLLGAFLDRKKIYIHDPYNTSDSYRWVCLKSLQRAVSQLVNELRTGG